MTLLHDGNSYQVAKPHLYHHYGFFGVFDGHNGSMCSEALCRGLHVTVAKQALIHQSPGKVGTIRQACERLLHAGRGEG